MNRKTVWIFSYEMLKKEATPSALGFMGDL
jgi:hypothetical protein